MDNQMKLKIQFDIINRVIAMGGYKIQTISYPHRFVIKAAYPTHYHHSQVKYDLEQAGINVIFHDLDEEDHEGTMISRTVIEF